MGRKMEVFRADLPLDALVKDRRGRQEDRAENPFFRIKSLWKST